MLQDFPKSSLALEPLLWAAVRAPLALGRLNLDHRTLQVSRQPRSTKSLELLYLPGCKTGRLDLLFGSSTSASMHRLREGGLEGASDLPSDILIGMIEVFERGARSCGSWDLDGSGRAGRDGRAFRTGTSSTLWVREGRGFWRVFVERLGRRATLGLRERPGLAYPKTAEPVDFVVRPA